MRWKTEKIQSFLFTERRQSLLISLCIYHIHNNLQISGYELSPRCPSPLPPARSCDVLGALYTHSFSWGDSNAGALYPATKDASLATG